MKFRVSAWGGHKLIEADYWNTNDGVLTFFKRERSSINTVKSVFVIGFSLAQVIYWEEVVAEQKL